MPFLELSNESGVISTSVEIPQDLLVYFPLIHLLWLNADRDFRTLCDLDRFDRGAGILPEPAQNGVYFPGTGSLEITEVYREPRCREVFCLAVQVPTLTDPYNECKIGKCSNNQEDVEGFCVYS